MESTDHHLLEIYRAAQNVYDCDGMQEIYHSAPRAARIPTVGLAIKSPNASRGRRTSVPCLFWARKEISGLTKEASDRNRTAQHQVHQTLCSDFHVTDETISRCQSHALKLAQYVNVKLTINAKA